MSETSVWEYIQVRSAEIIQWAKCGDSRLSIIPTVLWGMGAAALAQRLLAVLFWRFMFRRVPLWEVILQHLLFVWMVIYSLHFWTALVTILKWIVECLYEDATLDLLFQDRSTLLSQEDIESRKTMQQWVIWICGITPLAIYWHTRPRPERPPLMIWITNSPWQRREMGPYGYYLNRPLTALQSTTNLSIQQQAMTLRRAFSDSKILIKLPPKKKRHSKSV